MPRTLFDKIWDFHLVGRHADGRDLGYIDRHVLHELHAHHALAQLEKQHRPVHRPDLTFAVHDHTVASKPGRDDDTNPSGTAFLKEMRDGSRKPAGHIHRRCRTGLGVFFLRGSGYGFWAPAPAPGSGLRPPAGPGMTIQCCAIGHGLQVGRTHHERAKKIQGDHGGQAPRAHARRL